LTKVIHLGFDHPQSVMYSTSKNGIKKTCGGNIFAVFHIYTDALCEL